MSGSEIQALMALLDDPDEGVYLHVRSKLLEQGESILPLLRSRSSDDEDCAVTQSRLNELMNGVLEQQAHAGLMKWAVDDKPSILEGAFWLESVCGFGGDRTAGEAIFKQLRRDVWLELNEELTALEQIRILNHVLFSNWGFSGIPLSAQQAKHALPASVLSERSGGPLGLGILYWALAESLSISLHPISVSGLFFLAYVDPTWDHSTGTPPIWFYINPFQDGEMLSPEELQDLAEDLDANWSPALIGVPQMMQQIGRVVIHLCEGAGQTLTAQRITRLLQGICQT